MSEPSHRERIAYHEAGHAVACFLFGRRIIVVQIPWPGDTAGGGECRAAEWPSSLTTSKSGADFMSALYNAAGSIAEEKRWPPFDPHTGSQDVQNIKEMVRHTVGSDTEFDHLLEWMRDLWRRWFAIPAIWSMVEAVAQGLLETEHKRQKRYLNGEDVVKICKRFSTSAPPGIIEN